MSRKLYVQVRMVKYTKQMIQYYAVLLSCFKHRTAYEDKMYVAMVMRAFEHWRRLEKEAGKGQLLHMTGILYIGGKHKLAELIKNYSQLGMPYEVFSGTTIGMYMYKYV